MKILECRYLSIVALVCKIFMYIQVSSQQIIQSQPLVIAQSGHKNLYSSLDTALSKFQTSYTIPYINPNHQYVPRVIYFLKQYKNNDFLFQQSFFTYIKEEASSYWEITLLPQGSTNIFIISISFIALQNVYQNYYVIQTGYIYQVNLSTNSAGNIFTSRPYNIFEQTNGMVLSNDTSQNIIVSSWIGSQHDSIQNSAFIDISSQFINLTHFIISIAKGSQDRWHQVYVLTSIINLQLFPVMWNVTHITGRMVLSNNGSLYKTFSNDPSFYFNKSSYAFGYVGIIQKQGESLLNFDWQEFNSTTIKLNLGDLQSASFSILILYCNLYRSSDSLLQQSQSDDKWKVIGCIIFGILVLFAIIVVLLYKQLKYEEQTNVQKKKNKPTQLNQMVVGRL